MSPLEAKIAKAVEQRADRIVETLCDIVGIVTSSKKRLYRRVLPTS
jgi:hypothetical protein